MTGSDPGRGQYDIEYRQCPCFWGTAPAKYVKQLPKWLDPEASTALDLGAGEGKNAFYLRSLGLKVHAIEVSRYAMVNFLNRMIVEEIDDIVVTLDDVTRLTARPDSADVVVAYGLLHCLRTKGAARRVVDQIQSLTKPGGINVISAFTDSIPVPTEQSYLSPVLLAEDEILEWYDWNRWELLAHENGTLTETHPTSQSEHQHSLFRLASRRR